MAFIKDAGKLIGTATGIVLGAPIALVGEIVDSKFLQDVGMGVYKATERTGELLGNVAEGTTETICGVLNEDKKMQHEGVAKLLDSTESYVEGMVYGVGNVIIKGVNTIDAIIEGDSEKAIEVGKEVIKTVAVGTLAVGVADVIDGIADLDIEGDDEWDEIAHEEFMKEHPNMHHVTPHERVLSDGTSIWIDGDGNNAVDTFDGWYQDNPTHKG